MLWICSTFQDQFPDAGSVLQMMKMIPVQILHKEWLETVFLITSLCLLLEIFVTLLKHHDLFFHEAGPPESVLDWTKDFDSGLNNQNSDHHAFSRKYWRLLQCQNGELICLHQVVSLGIFEYFLNTHFLMRVFRATDFRGAPWSGFSCKDALMVLLIQT